MAVDLFNDSLDKGILLFGVCQCEVVRGAGAVKEVLDEVVGKCEPRSERMRLGEPKRPKCCTRQSPRRR
jgi:hypothetical protein